MNTENDFDIITLIKAHKVCWYNRHDLEQSGVCGCFYCRKIYSPKEVNTWIDEGGVTALCPHCGIDSVISERSGYPITKEFLSAMNAYWFSDVKQKTRFGSTDNIKDELLKQFIDSHLVLEIGKMEFIVDAPFELVDVVANSDYYISGILWWEHVAMKNQASSLGGGGPIDPVNNCFMYSEIYYESENFSENDIESCKEYLTETKNKYSGHEIIPSFMLDKK